MTSQSVALLFGRLGIQPSHSRPHVSNDNPFSEAQFKTLKYRPEFPDRFGSYEHAQSVCREPLHWYNYQHYHGSIGLMTPAAVHYAHAGRLLGASTTGLDGCLSPSSRALRPRSTQSAFDSRSGVDQPSPQGNDAPGCRRSPDLGPGRPVPSRFHHLRAFCRSRRSLRHGGSTLNANPHCLKVVDTFRRGHDGVTRLRG